MCLCAPTVKVTPSGKAAANRTASNTTAAANATAAAIKPGGGAFDDLQLTSGSGVPDGGWSSLLEGDPSQQVVKEPIQPLTAMTLLSAVPLMVLLLAAAVGGTYLFTHRAYFRTAPLPHSHEGFGGNGGNTAPHSLIHVKANAASGKGSAAAVAPAGPLAEGAEANAASPASATTPTAAQDGAGSSTTSADGVVLASAIPLDETHVLPDDIGGLALTFNFEAIRCVVPTGSSARSAAAASHGGSKAEEGAMDGDSEAGSVVSTDSGRKVLLHGISGCANEGEVYGIMGPSGACSSRGGGQDRLAAGFHGRERLR